LKKTILLLSVTSVIAFASPQCYKEAYSKEIVSADVNEIVFKSGTIMPYMVAAPRVMWDDKMATADLVTQVSQKYDAGGIDTPPRYLNDPGRLRYQPFFKELYGSTKDKIEKNLVKIDWPTLKGTKKLPVNKNAGASETLYKIGQELAKLSKEDRKWAEGAFTYKYRQIAGTDRLSLHSFGIAIDIAPNKTQYWRRDAEALLKKEGRKKIVIKETDQIGYKNTLPLSIVRVFEKHGWIWGGRWYHYDTMHFEYRPELLAKDCVLLVQKKK